MALRVPVVVRAAKDRLHSHPLTHRYLTQPEHRLWVSLCVSLAINMGYAAYKLVLALWYHSPWFGALAGYYLVLAVTRFLLVRGVRSCRDDLARQWRRCRFCGGLLMTLTLELGGMGLLAARGEATFAYPGHMIYAAAAFTFYTLVLGAVNLRRYHDRTQPLFGAVKAVSMATALVSLYALQTAMIQTFGNDPHFLRVMSAITGFAVFVLIASMAVGMLLTAQRALSGFAPGTDA